MQNDFSSLKLPVNAGESINKKSSDNKNENRIKYLWELPFDIRRNFTDLLDADKTWRELGGNYIKLSETELELISYAILRKESPTNTMLIKWEQSNVTIKYLYICLAKMKHLRAMSLLKNFVDKNLQELCNEHEMENVSISIEPNLQISRTSSNFNSTNVSKDQDEMCIKRNLTNANNSRQNDVKKKNQLIQTQSNFRDNFYTIATTINAHDNDLKYNELETATDNFHSSNIIGSGGFGVVYKGFWKGTKVAIKRLKEYGNYYQALVELRVLNQYRIDNIVPLYGISLDGPKPCLIYQFMINGSLDDRIQCKKNTLPLTWLQRINIGFGIAKALNYLHTRKGNPLIHGDVKSGNILLDSQLQPKLGDFGLAKYFQEPESKSTNQNNLSTLKTTKNFTHMTVTSVHGTVAYLPPEYLRCKIFSPAVDVYSYGIVLLEILTGLRAYDGKCLLIDIIMTGIEDNIHQLCEICQNLRNKSNELEIDNKKSCKLDKNKIYKNYLGQCLDCILYKFQDKRLTKSLKNLFWFHCILKLSLDCCNISKKKRPTFALVLQMYNSFFDQWQQFNIFNQVYQMNDLNLTEVNNEHKKSPLNFKLEDEIEKKAFATAPPMQTHSKEYISIKQNNNYSIQNCLNSNKESLKLHEFQLPLVENLNADKQIEDVLSLQNNDKNELSHNFVNKHEIIEEYEIPLLTELGITKKY